MQRNIFGWVCVDSQKVGTWKQADALAEAWLTSHERKPVHLPTWCRWMPPFLFKILPNLLKSIAVKDLGESLPDVVIAAGRQGVLVALALRHKVRTVVLMNPCVSIKCFDVVIAPTHDQLSGPNVISTQGAIHGIRPDYLVFPEHLVNYPSPKFGVLLGGNSAHGIYQDELAYGFARDLQNFAHQHGASLIITPSRRTPIDWLTIFTAQLKNVDYWIWDQIGANPYPDLLAGLDAIIVCEDSISMASEACVMGKTVLIYPTGINKPKFKLFYQQLFAGSYAQAFNTDLQLTSTPVLNELDRVVECLNVASKDWW